MSVICQRNHVTKQTEYHVGTGEGNTTIYLTRLVVHRCAYFQTANEACLDVMRLTER